MTDIENKMKLTRFLREENMKNRIRVKNREEILYGTGKPFMAEEDISDFYNDGHIDHMFYDRKEVKRTGSTFKIRTVMAVMVFALCLYLEMTESDFNRFSPKDWIVKQLNWSAEAKLIDFMSGFPYTLSEN